MSENNKESRNSLVRRLKKICRLEKVLEQEKKNVQGRIISAFAHRSITVEKYDDGLKCLIVSKGNTTLDVELLAKELKITVPKLTELLEKCRKKNSISTYPLVSG